MVSLKTVIKYILGQLLFFYKNIFIPISIDKKSIKAVLYTTTIEKKVFFKLTKRGFDNIINVVNSSVCDTVINQKGKYIVSNFDTFPETNAEIIFFTAKTAKDLNKIRSKPNYIFIPFKAFIFNFSIVIAFIFKRKFFFNSIKYWGELGLLYEKKKKMQTLDARRYIPFEFSRIEFLNLLYRKNLDFVVLRWFDELSTLTNPNEDVDILINTQDVDRLDQIMNNKIGILPIDVYSSTGEEETSYAGLPYFPQKLSNKALDTKIVFNNSFYIPSNYFHLVTFIYHVVFHKSLSSGLSINDKYSNDNYNKRNFHFTIRELFKVNNIEIENINLKTLYEFLKKNSFLPKYDLILKLKHLKNDNWFEYIINDVKQPYLDKFNFVEGLTVFLLREEATEERYINHLINSFDNYGFDLIQHSKIKNCFLEQAQTNIRGGKWDKGDFDINAGKPLYYFLVFDVFSKKPKGDYKQLYPNLENENATKLKIALRNVINNKSERTMNSIHSSDDFFEAVFYLEQLGYKSVEIEQLIKRCLKIKKSLSTEYKIIKDLSRHSSRAKVELIRFENNFAIKKTYKQNKLEYLNREIWLLNALSNTGFVPKILKAKDNYIIIEYIDDAISLSSIKNRMDAKNIKQFRVFFETLYSKNITILDINTSNVLLDKNRDLKIIDFEYAQEYIDKPDSITKIYELGKIPVEKVTVYPFGHEFCSNSYNVFWKRKIYMTKNQFFSIKNVRLIKHITAINKLVFDMSFFVNSNWKRAYKAFRRQFKKY